MNNHIKLFSMNAKKRSDIEVILGSKVTMVIVNVPE